MWERESAGGGSNQGKHLIASMHKVGLFVLCGTLSIFHHKPENKDRQKRWSVKGLQISKRACLFTHSGAYWPNRRG